MPRVRASRGAGMSKAPKKLPPKTVVKPAAASAPSDTELDEVLRLTERCRGRALTAANTALIVPNLSDALSVRDDVACRGTESVDQPRPQGDNADELPGPGYRARPKIYPLIPSQVPFNLRNFAQKDRMNCSSATSNRGIDFFGKSDDRFCGRSCSRWLHGGPLRRDQAG